MERDKNNERSLLLIAKVGDDANIACHSPIRTFIPRVVPTKEGATERPDPSVSGTKSPRRGGLKGYRRGARSGQKKKKKKEKGEGSQRGRERSGGRVHGKRGIIAQSWDKGRAQ